VFPKAIDVFAHKVSSRNAFSGRSVFASNSKQGGVSEITSELSNTNNIQKIRATS